jgi:dTDP-3-amino-3,4,6-trideoxy-alpha-D-glucose transaminase
MGDAGAVLCREASLATELRSLRDYGQTAKYVHARLGANSRLDELQAALMRSAFLPRLAQHTERRRTIAEHYRDNIRSSALTLPPPPPGSQSVWHLFPVLVQGKRDEFAAYLRQLGVSCGLHYPVLIPDQDALANVRHERADELLGARKFARSEISLPIHPYLTDTEVERVVAACNGWKP